MAAEQTKIQERIPVAIKWTFIVTATLVTMMSSITTATPLPVIGPPFGSCGQVGSGCLNGGNVSAQVTTNNCINFFNSNTPDTCGAASPADTFSENAQLDPSIFTLNATGTTKDLLFATPPPTKFLSVPGPLGTVFFDLTGVIPSAQPVCPANPSGVVSCSLGVFTLAQQDLSSSGMNCPAGQSPCGQVMVGFAFSAAAYLTDISTGSTPYQINYSSHFNNETVADLISKASSPSGISNSVAMSANPVAPTAVPEPSGFALAGAGLLALLWLTRGFFHRGSSRLF